MGAWGPALIGASMVILSNLIMVAYFSGKHSARLDAAESDIGEHAESLKDHTDELANHGERITWLEAKTNGQPRPH